MIQRTVNCDLLSVVIEDKHSVITSREWQRSAVDTGLVHGRFSMQPRGNLRQEKMFYIQIIFKFFLSEVNLQL